MIRKATCHISVEMPSGIGSSAEVGYGSATAFFIGPTTLLTAGHVMKPGQMGRAQLPGRSKSGKRLGRSVHEENQSVRIRCESRGMFFREEESW